MSDPLPQRAVIGVRISDDKAGDEHGVESQERKGRALAEQLGWGVLEAVIENDTSAYKRKRIRTPSGRFELRTIRPGFRRIIELLESGQADGYIALDLDRSVRDPRDLEDLVDVVEQRTPRIPVRSVTGSLRLDNDADITMARVMVAIANKSSRDTSRRVKSRHEELAAAGTYAGGGARRYGYEKDGNTVVPAEAEVLRDVVRRVLEDEALHSICVDLDRRGVRPVKAAKWSTKALGDMLRGGRIYGLRIFRGEVVGPASWPAIVDVELRDEVLARLEGRSAGRGKPPLKHWANRLLWCSHCGSAMVAKWNTGGRPHSYWCSPIRGAGCGKLLIAGPGTEAELERQVLAYLARPDVVQAMAAGSSKVAVAETRALLEADRADLTALAQAHGNRQITLPEWLAARAPIEARMKTYEGALRAVVPMKVRRVLEAKDRTGAWAELDPAAKRDVAQAILEDAGYRGWVVAPADRTKPRRFDADRLSLIKMK